MKHKKSKIFLWSLLSALLLLILLLIPFTINIFENLFPTKSNVIFLLKEENIKLLDEFEIVRYRKRFTVFQESFSIKISTNDKKRIINKLITTDNYKENVDTMYDIRQEVPRFKYIDKKYASSYKRDEVYGFQTFKTRSNGNAPNWVVIDIPETGNILYYDKFE